MVVSRLLHINPTALFTTHSNGANRQLSVLAAAMSQMGSMINEHKLSTSSAN